LFVISTAALAKGSPFDEYTLPARLFRVWD